MLFSDMDGLGWREEREGDHGGFFAAGEHGPSGDTAPVASATVAQVVHDTILESDFWRRPPEEALRETAVWILEAAAGASPEFMRAVERGVVRGALSAAAETGWTPARAIWLSLRALARAAEAIGRDSGAAVYSALIEMRCAPREQQPACGMLTACLLAGAALATNVGASHTVDETFAPGAAPGAEAGAEADESGDEGWIDGGESPARVGRMRSAWGGRLSEFLPLILGVMAGAALMGAGGGAVIERGGGGIQDSGRVKMLQSQPAGDGDHVCRASPDDA